MGAIARRVMRVDALRVMRVDALRVMRVGALRVMRVGAVVVMLAGCGPKPGPREEFMSSETLEHQDPKADTSHHPTLRTYSSGWSWGNLFGHSSSSNPFSSPGSPPHYYTGCGGCASDDPSSLLVLLASMPAFARRRRIRCSTASSM